MRNRYISGGLTGALLTIFNVCVILKYAIIPTELFSSLFILLMPGSLFLSLRYRAQAGAIGAWTCGAVALSVVYLMVIGLAANAVSSHSLSAPLLLLFFDIPLVAVCLVTMLGRSSGYRWRPFDVRRYISLRQSVLVLVPLLTVVVACVGAIRLNNGRTSIVSVCAVALVFALIFVAISWSKKLSGSFPWILFCASLAMLLMTSLRSGYISGWDISREYRLFMDTARAAHWSSHGPFGSYSSCLSITILPTVILAFTQIPSEYIFKMVFPAIFSVSPVALYFCYRFFVNRGLAAMAAFLVIAQRAYILEFTAIARQEVALMFFAMSLWFLADSRIPLRPRRVLFVVFCFGMIVSHYSTAYVALFVFIVYYIVRVIRYWRSGSEVRHTSAITARSLAAILVMGVLWYGPVTHGSAGLLNGVDTVAARLPTLFSASSTNNTVRQAVFGQATSVAGSELAFQRYVGNHTADYSPTLLPFYTVQPVSARLAGYLDDFYVALKYLLIGSMLIGSVWWLRRGRPFNDWAVLSVSSLGLMVCIVVLPDAANYYNFERLFQQTIFVSAVCCIWFIVFVSGKVIGSKSILLVLAICMVFFLFQTGVLTKYTGGSPTINLFSSGDSYYGQYVFPAEYSSIVWLNRTVRGQNDLTINADADSTGKLIAFGSSFGPESIDDVLFPSAVGKANYVFEGVANSVSGKCSIDGRSRFANGIYWYNWPGAFISSNKNCIYTDGESSIYH
jgi:uncharacterized membrane protein